MILKSNLNISNFIIHPNYSLYSTDFRMGKFKKQAKGSSTSIKNKMKKQKLDKEAESTDGKSKYLSAYKRAQLTFERLKAERKAETEKQRAERERQKEENDFNKEWRKK